MSHRDTLEAMHAALDATPDAWGLRLVLADLLEEMGDPVGAAGQRWQAANRKAPFKGPNGHWGWLSSRWVPYVGDAPVLPRPLSLRVSTIYDTRRDAEAALALALAAAEAVTAR